MVVGWTADRTGVEVAEELWGGEDHAALGAGFWRLDEELE